MRFTKPLAVMAAMVLLASSLLVGCSSQQKTQEVPLGASYYPGTLTSLLPNYPYPAMVFTATAQTKTQPLSGQACMTLTMTSSSLTTVTFLVSGSNDGGNTYVPLRVAPYAASLTAAITAVTATSNLPYIMNVSGFTNFKIVTSGTFTAASVTFQPTASSNPCPSF